MPMARIEALVAILFLPLLYMSIYPGFLIGALLLGIVLVPAIVCAGAGLGVLYGVGYLVWSWLPYRARKRARVVEIALSPAPRPRPAWRWIARVMIAASIAMMLSGWAPRLGFSASRSAFDRYLSARTPIGPEAGAPPRFVGLYRVDACLSDPRGGVYFRCFSHPDGIDADTVSYGFAHCPNPQGSPFGDAGYMPRPLGGDWFVFSASD